MRTCSNPDCRTPVTACMGFVKAGDFLEATAGIRAAESVRELCGMCSLRATNYITGDPVETFLAHIGWVS